MKTFKEHLSESLLFEDASATEMEKKIVSAYNDTKSPKSIPKQIAEKIKIGLSSSARAGILIHGGTRTAKRNPDWIGINSTSKSDIYFESKTGAKISLKKIGGSQLMSGVKSESLATFHAAVAMFGDPGSPAHAAATASMNALIAILEPSFKSSLVPGTNDDMTAAIAAISAREKLPTLEKELADKLQKKPSAAYKTDKEAIEKMRNKAAEFSPGGNRTGENSKSFSITRPLDVGKNQPKRDITTTVSSKDYMQAMQDRIKLQELRTDLSVKANEWFKNNLEFKKWFVFEAATGRMKFKGDPHARADYIGVWDDEGNIDMHKLFTGTWENPIPTQYIINIAKDPGTKISMSAKSGSGSKVNVSGYGKQDTALRVNLSDTISKHITESYNVFSKSMLMEEALTEEGILSRIKNWFGNLFDTIMNKLKELTKKGLHAVLAFIEFEPASVKTTGLRMFGY